VATPPDATQRPSLGLALVIEPGSARGHLPLAAPRPCLGLALITEPGYAWHVAAHLPAHFLRCSSVSRRVVPSPHRVVPLSPTMKTQVY
jgi:hypothetical protein